ncbi:MAG TPA: SAM-dependent chlorinase/fluorinase [Kiritimatiellia bacterium]|nr:SAM-dependent chlorinase/fluorinase [Kiritimatiellia bacterium]HRZ11941.1 SAM-dependent chlorinase/fluorinase [Kiritimatiellia bacterium]HSA17253.1 SAM-dependent chlorinase/fluorinase [Kiritimatiellia bacterium]
MGGPFVTLLTDFGTGDGYVAAMKGVLCSRAPRATVVDAAHDIPPHDVAAAAWTLGQYWRYFPPGTIHVAVVDPGVGTERAILLVEADSHLFLAPDNGVLTWVLRQARRVALRRLKAAVHGETVSTTFHGRDILAHAAGLLAAGHATVEQLGEDIRELVMPAWAAVERVGDGLRGQIVHVDRFGNLITGIQRHQALESVGAAFTATAGGFRDIPGRRTYADAQPGELIALFGSSDTLELAVNGGSAAERTGLGRGQAVVLHPALKIEG